MGEVLHHIAVQTPPWADAVIGRPNWEQIYRGYNSAVDWPTAGFFRELYAAYPSAKFVLTHRSPESWVASFSETIYKLLASQDQVPPAMRAWLAMATDVIKKTGFPLGLDAAGLRRAFLSHAEDVKASIPPKQLLIYEVNEGWGPLCTFLNVPVPSEEFPRTNDRAEFWDRVAGKI